LRTAREGELSRLGEIGRRIEVAFFEIVVCEERRKV
jgi:hypothetical protein